MSFRREIAVTQAHLRTDELRKELKSLGDVNTSAIEDYRELNERFQSLNAQCGDLRQAEADLNELIAKLTETMEKEFCEQFSSSDRISPQRFRNFSTADMRNLCFRTKATF